MKLKPKFDVATAKKLLASYAEKVVFYMKDNQLLKTQVEDLKTTLEINKKMLYNNIAKNSANHSNKIFTELKNENNRLSQLLSESKKENNTLQKKNYKLQDELNEKIQYYKGIIEENNKKSFIDQNKIIEKESIIQQLKKELEKYYRGDYISTKELLIGDPDTINTEINNELCESRELVSKYTVLLMEERKKTGELEKKIEKFKEYIENKKKGKKISQTFENIEMLDYILTPSSSSSEEEGKDNDKISSHTQVEVNDNLDSPLLNFPPKISQKKYLFSEISNNNSLVNNSMIIPKLDFSIVMTKYAPIRKINVVNTEVHSTKSSDEYIDKLKFQIKFYKNYADKYKKKLQDLNNIIAMFKQHLKRKSKDIIVTPETMMTTDKKKIDNSNICESMINNVSMVIDDEKEETFNPEEEFNYIIKEYNCKTLEENNSTINI